MTRLSFELLVIIGAVLLAITTTINFASAEPDWQYQQRQQQRQYDQMRQRQEQLEQQQRRYERQQRNKSYNDYWLNRKSCCAY